MKHVLLKHVRRLAAMLLVMLTWSAGAQAEERVDTIFSTVSGLEGDNSGPGLNTILTQEGNDRLLPMYKGAYYDGGSLWFYTTTRGVEGFEDSGNSIDVRSKFQVTGKIAEVMLTVGFNDSRAADDDLEITIYAGPVAESTPHKTFTTTTHDIRSYYIWFDYAEVGNATFNIRFANKAGGPIQGVLLREIDIEYWHEVAEEPTEDPNNIKMIVCGHELLAGEMNSRKDFLGDGTVVYERIDGQPTLTLENVNIDFNEKYTDSKAFVENHIANLQVRVIGQNTFTNALVGVYSTSLSFVGVGANASLTGNCTAIPLNANFYEEDDCAITIDNCALDFTVAAERNCVEAKTLTIQNGGYLKAKCADNANADQYSQAINVQTLTLGENIEILTKNVNYYDGHFNYNNHYYIYPTEVEIGKVVRYGLKLCGTSVTDRNATDILGDGTSSYDPATQTLTLNGLDATVGEHAGKGCIDLEDPNPCWPSTRKK